MHPAEDRRQWRKMIRVRDIMSLDAEANTDDGDTNK